MRVIVYVCMYVCVCVCMHVGKGIVYDAGMVKQMGVYLYRHTHTHIYTLTYYDRWTFPQNQRLNGWHEVRYGGSRSYALRGKSTQHVSCTCIVCSMYVDGRCQNMAGVKAVIFAAVFVLISRFLCVCVCVQVCVCVCLFVYVCVCVGGCVCGCVGVGGCGHSWLC
jgi:hypothetical protein